MVKKSFDSAVASMQKYLNVRKQTKALEVLAQYLENDCLCKAFSLIDGLVECLGDMPPGLYGVRYNLKRSLFECARQKLDKEQYLKVKMIFRP